MSFTQYTLDLYLFNNYKTHWIKEEFNMVILSAFYTEPPNINKLIQMFSFDIWFLILTSTLAITLFNTIYMQSNCE